MNKKTDRLIRIARENGEWASCFASLSSQQCAILTHIGTKTVTATETAIALAMPQRSISAAIVLLSKDGILERVSRGYYKVADSGFVQYLGSFDVPLISKEMAVEQSRKLVYQALLPLWQSLAKDGLIEGDADWCAAACAKHSGNFLKKNWRNDA